MRFGRIGGNLQRAISQSHMAMENTRSRSLFSFEEISQAATEIFWHED
jgi:hypothetical protein